MGTYPVVQKWAFALVKAKTNLIVKEQEKLVGFELSEGMVKAMHKAAEKYNIEHGIPIQKDNKNNDDVKDNKDNGNDNN